jgi:hypothetical protein
MRIVMDTSVLVAGLRSRLGASAALLKEIAANRVVLVASSVLLLEYEAVLKREEHGLPAQFVDGFLAIRSRTMNPAPKSCGMSRLERARMGGFCWWFTAIAAVRLASSPHGRQRRMSASNTRRTDETELRFQ